MKKNSIHTQIGFKVPDGYFDKLTDRVLENIPNDVEVEHAGFKIPKDYLGTLEDRIMSQVKEESKVIPLHTSSSKQWLYPLLAIAALFIGIITLNGLFTNDQINFADLEDSEITEYLIDSNFLHDEESIELLFADNSILSEISIEQNITDGELLEYLIEDATLNQIIIE